MLLMLTSWILVYTITSIFGFGLLQLTQSGRTETFSHTEIVLAGLTAVVVVAQAVSIVWPADYRLIGGLLASAVWVNWRLANQPVRVAVAALRRLAGQPLIWLFAVVILFFTIRTATNSDSGLYHVPAIRWYEQFRAIPGLGNLHGRLAFNSSFFVASAVFACTDLVGQPLFPLNGFLFLVFGAYVIQGINRPGNLPGVPLFRLLVLGLALYYLLYQVSSPTPDLWATLLPVFVFLFWLDNEPVSQTRLLLWVTLLLLCVTIKLGTVPVLLFVPVLLGTYWRLIDWKQVLTVAVLGGVILGPWLIRNVILSGYLVYPFPALDLFAVDWKIPLPAVRYEQDYVTFWGRYHIPEQHLNAAQLAWPLKRWVPFWWHMQGDPKTYFYYKLNRPMLVMALVSPLLMLALGLRMGLRLSRVGAAYGVALAGLLFWFLKAPEFRFGLAYVWMAALLPWIPLLGQLPLTLKRNRLLAGMTLAALLIFFGAKLVYRENPVSVRSVPVPNWYGYREQQADGVRLLPHQTQRGLTVLVPNPAPLEQRCFEVNQLCSPYLFSDLEKRGRSVEDGFRRHSAFSSSSLSYNPYNNEIQRYYPGLQ